MLSWEFVVLFALCSHLTKQCFYEMSKTWLVLKVILDCYTLCQRVNYLFVVHQVTRDMVYGKMTMPLNLSASDLPQSSFTL